MKTILITGASGFIAHNFIRRFGSKYKIIKLSHLKIDGHITLNELSNDPQLQDQIDVILNLAGVNIGQKRWTCTRKKDILSSRLNTTRAIVELFSTRVHKPHLISASAVGIYDVNAISDEDTVIDYNQYYNFSQEITKKWEQQALKYCGLTTVTRFGVVLSGKGGALSKILPSFKLGCGGRLGGGEQLFPWIALDDLLMALNMIIEKRFSGVFNLVAPEVVNNRQLTQKIGMIWHRPTFLHLPAWTIRLLFGQMGDELLLNGSGVLAKRLLNEGFKFQYPNLGYCLEAIKGRKL